MTVELTQQQLTAFIRELLAEILELPVEEVLPHADLIDELDADSLKQLELMTEIERQLDLSLDVEDWHNARTLTELVERTALRLQARHS